MNRATSVAEREPWWYEDSRRTWGLPVISYGDYPASKWHDRLLFLIIVIVVAAVGAAVVFGCGYL